MFYIAVFFKKLRPIIFSKKKSFSNSKIMIKDKRYFATEICAE